MYSGIAPPDFEPPMDVLASPRRDALNESILNERHPKGDIRWCNQGAMWFGRDKGIPSAARPVLVVRPYLGKWVVLPCTTKKCSKYFFLDQDRVRWVSPRTRNGYASYMAEWIPWEFLAESKQPGGIEKKFGYLTTVGRDEFLKWVGERFS